MGRLLHAVPLSIFSVFIPGQLANRILAMTGYEESRRALHSEKRVGEALIDVHVLAYFLKARFDLLDRSLAVDAMLCQFKRALPIRVVVGHCHVAPAIHLSV